MGCSQSFAKNAGLYGERVGALHIIVPNKETANRVRSQLSVLQRSEISNPPSYGARVVSSVAINTTFLCTDLISMLSGCVNFEQSRTLRGLESRHSHDGWPHH